jgi:protein involved in polysaccharide export with SLBB domain
VLDAPKDEPQPAEALHYVLQRGDEIELRVLNLPELEGTTLVRPDGMISVALLDDVEAAGLTPDYLAAILTESWSPQFRDPQVTVVVRVFASHNVYVGGEVGKPGLIPLRNRLSSIKAVFDAGGFKDTAQLTNVILLRNAGGKREIFNLNAKEILAGEAPDMRLHAYDVIFVPKSKIARVNLFVEQWITQMIPIQLQGVLNYSYVGGVP